MTDTNYNLGEYGQEVYSNLGQDISTASELTMILEPKVGEVLERNTSQGVSLGTVDLNINNETYLANEYIKYTLKKEELSRTGLWRNKGTAQLAPTNLVIGDYERFTVMD